MSFTIVISMDVYLDDGNVVYNVEMQATRSGHLPKRSRYYAEQVDINQLKDEKEQPGKTTGDNNRINDGMKELLKYMNNTKNYPVESTQYGLVNNPAAI